MTIRKFWRTLYLVFVLATVLAVVLGCAFENVFATMAGAVVGMAAALAVSRKLRCPACGENVARIALDGRNRNSGFFCPRCGRRIEWE